MKPVCTRSGSLTVTSRNSSLPLLLRKLKTARRYGLETWDLSWRQVWCQSRISTGEKPERARAISCSCDAVRQGGGEGGGREGGRGEYRWYTHTHTSMHQLQPLSWSPCCLASMAPSVSVLIPRRTSPRNTDTAAARSYLSPSSSLKCRQTGPDSV